MKPKEPIKAVFEWAKEEDITICDSCLCYCSPGFTETIYNQAILELESTTTAFTCLCEDCDAKQPSIFDMFDEDGNFKKTATGGRYEQEQEDVK